MSTQDRKLFDLLDGFEMTKSEYDWLERRFENMTAKESMLFRGAMQIERPEKTFDVLQLINQLDHYELFYGAGDDIGLGHFVMNRIKHPASSARAYLDPAKVGAAFRQQVGSAFCDGHFIKISSLTVPLLDGDLTQYPDKGDYGIRVKLASRSNMEGIWVGFPDTSAYMDSSHPDELLLALDALEVETLTECIAVDVDCGLPQLRRHHVSRDRRPRVSLPLYLDDSIILERVVQKLKVLAHSPACIQLPKAAPASTDALRIENELALCFNRADINPEYMKTLIMAAAAERYAGLNDPTPAHRLALLRQKLELEPENEETLWELFESAVTHVCIGKGGEISLSQKDQKECAS